jgi:hypothetical protein
VWAVDRPTHQTEVEKIGLLANGTSGTWEVSIDETISGRERWFAQIEGRSVYLYFEIASLDTVIKTRRFLTSDRDGCRRIGESRSTLIKESLRISKAKTTSVTLIRDDEYADRFFFVVGPIASPIVRLSLMGKDVRDLVRALQQIEQDIGVPAAPEEKRNHEPQKR